MQYGTRKVAEEAFAGNQKKNKVYNYAKQIADLKRAISEEGEVDFVNSPGSLLDSRYATAKEMMKNFFINESYDPNLITELDDVNEHKADMSALFENMMDAFDETLNRTYTLNESVPLNSLNPIVGMSPMVYKDILINNMFYGAVETATAVSQIIPIRHEHQYMTSPDKKTKIDISKQQHMIKELMEQAAPFKEVEITLPESGSIDLIAALGGTDIDSLSTASFVSKIWVAQTEAPVDPATEVVFAEKVVDFRLIPQGYNTTKGQRYTIQDIILPYTLASGMPDTDILTVTMVNNKLNVFSQKGKVNKIAFKCRLDTSNAMVNTAKFSWEHENSQFQINDGIPLSAVVNPSELKDIAASFNIDQVAKLMGGFRTIMSNYKDSYIYDGLKDSYARMDDNYEGKFSGVFDFADLQGNISKDPIEWRHTMFIDVLESYMTHALNYLRDPNVAITVFGRPDLVRKVEPNSVEYQSPKNIGSIPLEFNRVVTTKHGRQYNFNSSMKINKDTENYNNLRIILNPTSSDRYIYRLYNYQLVISNEIKSNENPLLPSIYAFERFEFTEWEPVQGVIKLLNPTGYKDKDEYKHL